MTQPLAQLAYVSQATQAFPEDELAALLKLARRKNRAVGVTGMLLFDDGLFLQILEGPLDEVKRTFERISADPRHASVQRVYLDEACREREFAQWNMGGKILGDRLAADYKSLDDRVKQILGKADPDGDLAHQLLLDFRAVQDSYIDLPE